VHIHYRAAQGEVDILSAPAPPAVVKDLLTTAEGETPALPEEDDDVHN
jgi:hypothetical protein